MPSAVGAPSGGRADLTRTQEHVPLTQLSAGLGSFGVYWAAVCALVCAFISGGSWTFAGLPFMLIVYHGTHEAVHKTLVPKPFGPDWLRRAVAFTSGYVGFAVLGHNFLLLRWSHGIHHRDGRRTPGVTIDGAARTGGWPAKLKYYAGLLGFSHLFHELLGYLYLVCPAKYNLIDRSFKPWKYRGLLFLWCQVGVLATTAVFFYFGGWYYAVCRLAFMIYWGATQNVAHYGLEIGVGDHPELIARSYRVNRVVNYLLFGAGYYHLEHHAFPSVPGLRLQDAAVRHHLTEHYGITSPPKVGLLSYVADVARQYRGPDAVGINPAEWRTGFDL
jgi:fatty acid desaturase